MHKFHLRAKGIQKSGKGHPRNRNFNMSVNTVESLAVGEIAWTLLGGFIIGTSPNIRTTGANAAVGTVLCLFGASELTQWLYQNCANRDRPKEPSIFNFLVWPSIIGVAMYTGVSYLTLSK